MILISSVIGVVLIFVCVLNLLVHYNKTQILDTIYNTTKNVSTLVTDKVYSANAFLTINKNYELAILFISLCVCTTIFVLNISLRDINCENKNCKNCNILVVLYNIFYIYFFLILIIYIFGNITNNITNNNTDNVNILIKDIIDNVNIIKNLKEKRDRFITSLLFLGFLIVGQSISSYCDKFFDIDNVFLALVTILVSCLYILCLCVSRNIFEYKFVILIFILLVFNFIFKYIFIRGSKPLLNFDKKEEYDTFLIVIMVFILSLNLVNLIYKVIKPYFNSNKL